MPVVRAATGAAVGAGVVVVVPVVRPATGAAIRAGVDVVPAGRRAGAGAARIVRVLGLVTRTGDVDAGRRGAGGDPGTRSDARTARVVRVPPLVAGAVVVRGGGGAGCVFAGGGPRRSRVVRGCVVRGRA